MKCEKVQELIITDYADGELRPEARLEIESHIRVCEACRQFEAVMMRDIREPFARTVKEAPSAYIWERVKQAVTSVPGKPDGIFGSARELIGQVLLNLSKIPRPVAAFAATAMVIVAIMIARPTSDRSAVDEYLIDQTIFIASLDTAETNGYGMIDTDIRSGAEKFM